MGLASDLELVAHLPYDPKSPARRAQQIFVVLERLAAEIRTWCPRGYRVDISKGAGNLPEALWIAILREDVTTTPTAGIYLVFLFHLNRQTVSLSLNQGVTEAGRRARLVSPRVSTAELLRAEAYSIVEVLPESETSSFSRRIELGGGRLTPSYAAGNIVAKTWRIADGVDEVDVRETFDALLGLYEQAVELKEAHLTLNPGRFQLAARDPRRVSRPEPVFAPKSSADYLVQASMYIEPQVRTRAHETLVRDIGEFAKDHGYVAATNRHPIDLTLERESREVLVEVKMLDPRHPASGIRESIGQLFEYKKFLRPPDEPIKLMAVYNLKPEGAHRELLSDLRIESAWRAASGFEGPAVEAMISHRL